MRTPFTHIFWLWPCLWALALPALAQVPFALQKIDNQTLAPVNGSYVNETDTLRFASTSVQQVYVYRIATRFLPAVPPMQADGNVVAPELKVDSLFALPANQNFVLPAKGLYFAQADTNRREGLGFRVEDRHYPRYRNVDKLIEALVYISTPEEIGKLYASPDKKAALDNYWLAMVGNEENARRVIKIYYQRVEYANRHFSNYKEGWKTDQGMVYIAFGEPNQMGTNASGQVIWEYSLGGRNSIRFTFVQKSNQFSGQHYELLRSARHRDAWYQAIERLRMGLVAN